MNWNPSRYIVLSTLAFTATGCTAWKHTHPLPSPDTGSTTFRAARVTPRAGGMMMVLRDVEVTADSVTGWLPREDPNPAAIAAGRRPEPRRRVALHRDDVLVFERGGTDPWRTGSAVLLGLTAVWAALAAYFYTQSG